MQPAWKYISDNTKEDEHQNQSMFSPNVTIIPKSTTGLEDKPLLPSVFRPKSTLYTAPLNVVAKTYLGNTTGSLNNPTVPAIQIAPSQSYLSSAVAYSSSSNPDEPTIPKQNSVFSVNNSAILQASYRFVLPHDASAQNRVLLSESIASSLVQPCHSSLYNHVPCEVSVQNIVPLPGNNVSSLAKPYTSTGVYNHALPQAYEPLPPYYYGTGMPNTIANFDERCSNEFRNQNVGIPFESDIRPVLPMKLVSTVHSNLTEINVSNQQNYSTVVYNKTSSTHLASGQASDASIPSASLTSSTLGELTAYSSGLDSRRPFESNELDEQTDQHSTTPDITSFKTNALVELREHSTGSDNRRPFFGELKYSSDLRRSNSPLCNFREESSVLTNRESGLTRDYRESRYRDRCYLNDSSKDVRPYLSDDHERLNSCSDAREAAYSPNKSRGYHNSSPSYDRVDKDLPRRLYSSDTNSLSSFDGVERSSYSKSGHLPYWSKESRNYSSSPSYDSVGKDSPRRLYPRNRDVIDFRDELSGSGAATDRHNYSRHSSRVSSRSRSPVQRHRHSLARKSRERTQTPKEKYSVSKEKLRNERRRLSPGRNRDSPHSSQKRERRKGLSPRRKSSSVASDSSARSKRPDSSRLSERRRKPETNESLPSPKKSKEKDDKDKSMSRALKCFCLPEPYIERKFVYEQSSRYYQTSSSSQKSTSTATDNVAKLHKEFEDMLLKSQTVEDCPTTSSTVADSVQDEVEDSQYVFELLDKPDDEDNDVSSESDVDLEGYDVIDVYDSESSDEDVTPLAPQKENKFKNQDHPRKLHSELWFNVEGELNHGKECLCSAGDKQKWIVHNVYPNEQ